MFYLIAYDIADDRRRERMARTLLDYGGRIQESVFTAHLDEALYQRMMERVGRTISANEDRVHVVRLCAICERDVIALGLAEVKKDAAYWIL